MSVISGAGMRGLAGLALIAIVAATATIAYFSHGVGDRPPPPPESDSVLSAKPIRLAPGVYVLGRAQPSAVYAVETSKGLTLIDSGLDSSASIVIEQLSQLGLDVNRLQAILLTHCHADHSMGAAALRARTGAKIYAGLADCPTLRAGGPREAFVSIFHMPSTVIHPTPVDVELADADQIEMGDTRFTAIASPGHTPGSTCYLMEQAGQRVLFTGDVILSLSSENPEPLGTYSAYLAPAYRGNARDFLNTLKRLRAMPVPDLVCPGHPNMDPAPQSPRLSRQRWEKLLDTGIGAMTQLLARRDADGANFLDGNPKELLPGLQYLGDLKDYSIYCLKSPAGLLLFDAPGGNGLIEFLESRFEKLGWKIEMIKAVVLTSVNEEETSGLASLVEKTGCSVVAPDGARETVLGICPSGSHVVAEAELMQSGWLDVKCIPLAGYGAAPTAYLIRWGKKTVLMSGRIPSKLSVPAFQQLIQHLAGSHGNWVEYSKSLDKLRQTNPDLWLPAAPVYGQNANLYDHEWIEIIDSLEHAFSR